MKKSHQKGLSKECAKLTKKLRQIKLDGGEGHRASRWTGRCHLVEYLPALQQSSFGELHLLGIDGTRRQHKEEVLQLVVCAVCGGKYEWSAPNRILVVQLGSDANEAKVFRSHAAPQSLCENVFNALKLLAYQQTDGDSPIQSYVTGLHERSRRGIMDGSRSFIGVDNHSALDVGHLRKGLRSFQVQRPKFSEDYPEVLEEGADDLTLKAEELDTLNACINVDHIEENKWRPPLLTQIGTLSAKEWEELYFNHGEVSWAAGARKPSESQKAKALWAMKAAKDRREEFYDPARRKTTSCEGNRQDLSCGKSASRTQSYPWTRR